MRTSILATLTAGLAAAAVALVAAPASAAQAPDEHAPCLATVFQAQAVAAPQTVSDRILEIRELYLEGDQFGQVLRPLTQFGC